VPGRASIPLIVLTATLAALLVAKIHGERRARLRHAVAQLPSSGGVAFAPSPSSREPALAASGPPPGGSGTIGSGRVAEGTRMLHQDNARTHRASGRAPRAPHERWRVTLGGPVVGQVTLAPDEKTAYACALDGTLAAIDRAGVVKWKFSLGDRAYATPLVGEGGVIYVGSDAKRFHAVAPDGTLKWKLDVDGEADSGALLLPDGRIAFAAGPALYVVSSGGEVRARFRARKKIFTAPAAAPDGTLYVGSQDHFAYAVRPDGTQKWSIDLGSDVDGGPAIGDDGAVYFGTDGGRVVKVPADPGTPPAIGWSIDVGGYVRGAISVARDGTVLTGVYGPTPGVLRLAPEDGRLLGAFRVPGTGSREFGVHGGPLEDDDGTLLFGAEDDRVYALERTGTVRFHLDRGSDVDAPVTLTRDGALIVGADDGTVAELGD
jgi:outer membrane protein assembly factor BamB